MAEVGAAHLISARENMTIMRPPIMEEDLNHMEEAVEKEDLSLEEEEEAVEKEDLSLGEEEEDLEKADLNLGEEEDLKIVVEVKVDFTFVEEVKIDLSLGEGEKGDLIFVEEEKKGLSLMEGVEDFLFENKMKKIDFLQKEVMIFN